MEVEAESLRWPDEDLLVLHSVRPGALRLLGRPALLLGGEKTDVISHGFLELAWDPASREEFVGHAYR